MNFLSEASMARGHLEGPKPGADHRFDYSASLSGFRRIAAVREKEFPCRSGAAPRPMKMHDSPFEGIAVKKFGRASLLASCPAARAYPARLGGSLALPR